MIGEWLACRLPALECGDTRRLRRSRFGHQVVFGGIGFEVLELQLHLLKQTARAFGAGTKLLALQLGDLQLEVGDHRLGGALAGMGVGELRFRFVRSPGRCCQQRLERFNVVRKGENGGFHARQ